jgi:predicted nuclease of restriction endonuclease-like (RecB) superfamily
MAAKKTGKPGSADNNKQKVAKKTSVKKSPAKANKDKALSRSSASLLPVGYGELLEDLKSRVRTVQVKAAVAVNRELIQLYWDIGRLIVERQQQEGWGTSVIDRLASDLQKAFPGLKGFSPSNVSRMRAFFLAYSRCSENSAQPVPKLTGRRSAQAVPRMDRTDFPQLVGKLATRVLPQAVGDFDGTSVPQPFGEIPWGHNAVLIEKLKELDARRWYAIKTIEHGWSRAVLTVQIETNLFGRQGKAVTNFSSTLPSPQSDLAQQTLKDPYMFDFLTLREDAVERDLESGLIDHVQKFLLELGAGFAFVGRQYHLPVSNDDFYLDLLFYHLKLRCYVVIDLKMHKFTPEDAGKLNFYLSAADSQLRHPDDQPTIGIVLCKTQDRVIAEYALRDISKPIGVAEWKTKLVHSLPEPLKSSLPTIEQIEEELGGTT